MHTYLFLLLFFFSSLYIYSFGGSALSLNPTTQHHPKLATSHLFQTVGTLVLTNTCLLLPTIAAFRTAIFAIMSTSVHSTADASSVDDIDTGVTSSANEDMGFRARFERDINEEWREYYIRYRKLRNRLRKLHLPTPHSQQQLQSFLESVLKLERLLDRDVEKAILFYLKTLGEIALSIQSLSAESEEKLGKFTAKQIAKLTPSNLADIYTVANQYTACARRLELLLKFVEANTRAVRKLAKLFATQTRMLSTTQFNYALRHGLAPSPLPAASTKLISIDSFQSAVAQAPSRHLELLQHHDAFDAVISSLAAVFDRLSRAEEFIIETSSQSPVWVSQLQQTSSEELQAHVQASSQFNASPKLRREAKTVLADVFTKREKLRERSSRFAATLAQQAAIFLDEEVESEPTLLEVERRLETPEVGFALNLASAFLYIVSYYCILPTAATYSQMLGADRALAGIIVGGAPLAGLASSVLFSWWSNRGFKIPLLFACTCCLIGNLVYAMAWSFKSIPMVLAGRLLVGFGGARALNRRYIADNAPRSQRVRRSAEFVAASAIGMAAGPALASLIAQLPEFTIFGLGFLHETTPGWILAVVWAIQIWAVQAFFQEPPEKERRAIPLSTFGTSLPGPSEETPLLKPSKETNARGPLATPLSIQGKQSISTVTKNKPLLLCLWIFFLIKLVCEALTLSVSLLMPQMYGWSQAQVGIFLGILGTLIFPANAVVIQLQQFFDERELFFSFQTMMLAGCGVTLPFLAMFHSKELALLQFVVGAVLVFVSTNVIEAVCMSIATRMVPPILAKGTFNIGLLSTESGMFGRVAGDAVISVVARLFGAEQFLIAAFLPATLATGGTLWYTWLLREQLLESEDYDSCERNGSDGVAEIEAGGEDVDELEM